MIDQPDALCGCFSGDLGQPNVSASPPPGPAPQRRFSGRQFRNERKKDAEANEGKQPSSSRRPSCASTEYGGSSSSRGSSPHSTIDESTPRFMRDTWGKLSSR